MSSVPPLVWLVGGGLLLPLLPRTLRRLAMLVLPALVIVHLLQLSPGTEAQLSFWGGERTVLTVDAFRLVFGWIFAITVLVWSLYAWHLDRALEPASAFVYAGGALGVVFAGDWLSLFLCWELMAVASTLVILAAGTQGARQAAYRYVIVHFVGGVLLLLGIGLLFADTGSLAVGHLGDELDSLAKVLILLGLCVNAGVPPFSAWVPDAYPEASPTGTVFLSAFTTKTAVFVIAVCFAGLDLLVVVGALMAIYGVFFALNDNDPRRVLSHSITNQVGFMICGVGIGTDLALNGVAAHAFCHILYKSLLLMSAGAVLYRTGKRKYTDLGGLWRTMPWTLTFALIGGLSIAALPLTNGFVSKPMILGAAAGGVHDAGGIFTFAWLLLMVASAAVLPYAGLKYPWFVFFGQDSGMRPKEAPGHMRLAMGVVALLCVGIGVWPEPLYNLLPHQDAVASFHTFTADHIIQQLAMLVASVFAFFLLLPALRRTDTITLDTDWFHRRGAARFRALVAGPLMTVLGRLSRFVNESVPRTLTYVSRNPPGAMRLVYDRALMAWAALFGTEADVDRAQARLHADRERYAVARPGSAWPIGTTVLYFALGFLLVLALLLWD